MKQLKNKDVTKIKLKNGNTVEKEIRRHASILADCIMEELDEVYNSYESKAYKRSYNLYDSLYIDEGLFLDVSAKGAVLSLKIHFDDGAIHDSFSGENANTAILLNEGYQTTGSFSHIPYFGHRKASRFIEKGIEKYKKKVQKPFKVKLTINDDERVF